MQNAPKLTIDQIDYFAPDPQKDNFQRNLPILYLFFAGTENRRTFADESNEKGLKV